MYTTRSKTETISFDRWAPLYTNPASKKPQTIYLGHGIETGGNYGNGTVPDASYDYDNHIFSWFSKEELDEATKAAKEAGFKPRSAGYVEVYLRTLYKDPSLELVHIIAGVNRSNGCPYRVYGYKRNGT